MSMSRNSLLLFSSSIFFTYFPGLIICADVTLSSIEIFTTHEWIFPGTPAVYFRCKGDNKTKLPDIQKAHALYSFKGEESWQPLTNFSSKKCKRCGIYEEDKIIKDDVFDEWELCPSDFTTPDGIYVHYKGKEFNASFLCPECLSFSAVSVSPPTAENHNHQKKGLHVAVIVLLTVLGSIILILGMLAVYKHWQKRKREQDQARFLKLFEDEDDIEDELGLGTII